MTQELQEPRATLESEAREVQPVRRGLPVHKVPQEIQVQQGSLERSVQRETQALRVHLERKGLLDLPVPLLR